MLSNINRGNWPLTTAEHEHVDDRVEASQQRSPLRLPQDLEPSQERIEHASREFRLLICKYSAFSRVTCGNKMSLVDGRFEHLERLASPTPVCIRKFL